jgi:hypothetical protein
VIQSFSCGALTAPHEKQSDSCVDGTSLHGKGFGDESQQFIRHHRFAERTFAQRRS